MHGASDARFFVCIQSQVSQQIASAGVAAGLAVDGPLSVEDKTALVKERLPLVQVGFACFPASFSLAESIYEQRIRA
jgi:hypothetical protein